MTLNKGQAERVMNDVKRIAQVTSSYGCVIDCLKRCLQQYDMDDELRSSLDNIRECLEVKAMLIGGLGDSLHNDILGMREHNASKGETDGD